MSWPLWPSVQPGQGVGVPSCHETCPNKIFHCTRAEVNPKRLLSPLWSRSCIKKHLRNLLSCRSLWTARASQKALAKGSLTWTKTLACRKTRAPPSLGAPTQKKNHRLGPLWEDHRGIGSSSCRAQVPRPSANPRWQRWLVHQVFTMSLVTVLTRWTTANRLVETDCKPSNETGYQRRKQYWQFQR